MFCIKSKTKKCYNAQSLSITKKDIENAIRIIYQQMNYTGEEIDEILSNLYSDSN